MGAAFLIDARAFSKTAYPVVRAFVGTLQWDASDGAIEYRVYWGTSSATYTRSVVLGNVLAHPVGALGLLSGALYYLAVKAWDGADESDASNEIQVFDGIQIN